MSATDAARGLYVDTSALARVLLDEPDSELIAEEISRHEQIIASESPEG